MFSRRPYARHNRGRINRVGRVLPPEVATDLVAWLSFHDPAYYTLSGTTVTSVINRVTGNPWTVAGAPTFGATSFNGGPGVTLVGSTDYFWTTNGDVVSPFRNTNAKTVSCDVAAASDDASEFIVGAGRLAGSNDSRRGFGLSPTAAGAWRSFTDNDAGSTIEVLGVDGAPTIDPTILQWYGTDTTDLLVNGSAAGGSYPGAQDPTPLTPSHVVWGAITSSTGVISGINGVVSQLFIHRSVLPASGAPTSLLSVREYMAALNNVAL